MVHIDCIRSSQYFLIGSTVICSISLILLIIIITLRSRYSEKERERVDKEIWFYKYRLYLTIPIIVFGLIALMSVVVYFLERRIKYLGKQIVPIQKRLGNDTNDAIVNHDNDTVRMLIPYSTLISPSIKDLNMIEKERKELERRVQKKEKDDQDTRVISSNLRSVLGNELLNKQQLGDTYYPRSLRIREYPTKEDRDRENQNKKVISNNLRSFVESALTKGEQLRRKRGKDN